MPLLKTGFWVHRSRTPWYVKYPILNSEKEVSLINSAIGISQHREATTYSKQRVDRSIESISAPRNRSIPCFHILLLRRSNVLLLR
jgi:hypothetical protein